MKPKDKAKKLTGEFGHDLQWNGSRAVCRQCGRGLYVYKDSITPSYASQANGDKGPHEVACDDTTQASRWQIHLRERDAKQAHAEYKNLGLSEEELEDMVKLEVARREAERKARGHYW